MLVPRSNAAKQGALAALLDPSTHCRAPLTHTSHEHHWPIPATADQQSFQSHFDPHRQPFQAFLYVRFRRFWHFLVGVSLMTADVGVVVVRLEAIHVTQRICICRVGTRARRKALVKVHTMDRRRSNNPDCVKNSTWNCMILRT
jgi:hypothetical protein